jgi:cell division protein FtsN
LRSLQAMVWRGDRHESAEADEPYVEQEDLHANGGHEDEGTRKIFAARWFRVLLVLASLAAVVMVALPYVLDWFEPAPSSVKAPTSARYRSAPAPVPPSSTARPRPEPALSSSTAALKPASPTSDRIATPMLPARWQAGARAPEPASRPLQAVKVPGRAHESDRPAAVATQASEAALERSAGHWVQLGLFRDPNNAERLARSVREQGFPVQVATVTRSPREAAANGTYHLVRAGAFPDQARAVAARDDLKMHGYSGFLTAGAGK